MKLLKALLGAGVLAGAAVAAVKLIEKFDERKNAEWTAVLGDFPDDMVVQPEMAETAEVIYTNADTYPPTPNVNPVDAAAAAPVTQNGKLDPTKIASPEDFQNWDELGCQS